MRFNKNTSAINLPTSPTDSGTKAIISGWGYIGVNEMDLPETLQKATMTMIDHKECKKRDEDGEFFKEQICAVNVVGIGICQVRWEGIIRIIHITIASWYFDLSLFRVIVAVLLSLEKS